MDILDCGGVFLLPVPPSWSVQGEDGVVELISPSGGAALHISTYHRTLGSPVEPQEARLVLEHFTATASPSQLSLREEADVWGARAAASFFSEGPASQLEWRCTALVWSSVMLVCSCAAAPGSPDLLTATQVFAGIRPSPKSVGKRLQERAAASPLRPRR